MKACGIALLWATMAAALPPQTFITLYSFDDTDGDGPQQTLVQGTDGKLYGTTVGGGAYGYGTVFKVTPSGKLTTLWSFDYPESDGPAAPLIQAPSGEFYGTTLAGGGSKNCPPGCGTVFKISASGELMTVHSFDLGDGEYPSAGLVLAINGKFYGTTRFGGANDDGTVFKMTQNGSLTTLHSFDKTDGYFANAALVQANNGKFYGTTTEGGSNDDGTVFKMTQSGTLTTLHSFDGSDGDGVQGLIQGTDGNFYGITSVGGANRFCDSGYGCGTIFKMSTSGSLTTLYSFCSQNNCTDGAIPNATLVEGTDGNFYGTTANGGSSSSYCYNSIDSAGCGTAFEITPAGELTTIHSFCSQGGSSCIDGYFPNAGLVQDTNGTFYGTTTEGGVNTSCNAGQGCGTIFSLAVGLGPFVKTQPSTGTVGAAVTILGTDLTGVTNVRFNGLESKFTIVSATEITTTVPNGATTSPVRVITPNGKLQSNVPFRVR
jgi:uncharacterized repeat protein (TIGR03803 family)